MDAVRSFVAIPQADARSAIAQRAVRTDDLVALGPITGDLFDYYEVEGSAVSATVDVRDNHVAQLLFLGAKTPTTGNRLSNVDIVRVATSFMSAHAVALDGMVVQVEDKDRGEIRTVRVTWRKIVNGAEVPIYRVVEMDAASGVVFSMYSISRPYTDPPLAAVARPEAVTAAEAVARQHLSSSVPASTRFDISKADLQLTFDRQGNQRLVWSVMLIARPANGDAAAVAVTVDAITGTASFAGASE